MEIKREAGEGRWATPRRRKKLKTHTHTHIRTKVHDDTYDDVEEKLVSMPFPLGMIVP